MRKKHVVLAIAALTLVSLSGCHKDKPVQTEPAPLETIAPDDVQRAENDINDKLDDSTNNDLEIEGYLAGPDGKVLSGDEAIAYEEEMVYGIKHDDNKSETTSESEGDSAGGMADQNNTSNNETGSGTELKAETENGSETSAGEESRPDVDVASDQREFTAQEYEEMQKEIDEWTYQEAIKRMGRQQ